MSRSLHRSLPVAAALLLAAASPDLGAQQVRPDPSSPRILATYRFGMAHPATVTLPRTVTVADSAGQLVAIAAIPGERTPRHFAVAVVERDLVLQGETPAGTLTLVLEKQADGEVRTLESGRWSLDSLGGTLRARR